MKKLITLGVAAFAFAATMGVASANFNQFPGQHMQPAAPVNVSSSNVGSIMNNTNTSALTGKNMASSHSWFGGGAGIVTGVADAEAYVQNQAGNNVTRITGATGPVTVSNSNMGRILNSTNTMAGTGMNHVHASGGVAGITTGSALSVSNIMNVIGFNTTTIGN